MKKGVYAIHCETENQAIQICNFLHKNGLKWDNGKSYLDVNRWIEFKHDTVYTTDGKYGSYITAKQLNYKVYPAKDFIREEKINKLLNEKRT